MRWARTDAEIRLALRPVTARDLTLRAVGAGEPIGARLARAAARRVLPAAHWRENSKNPRYRVRQETVGDGVQARATASPNACGRVAPRLNAAGAAVRSALFWLRRAALGATAKLLAVANMVV